MITITDYPTAKVAILEFLKTKAALAIGPRKVRLEAAITAFEVHNQHEPAEAALRSELELESTTESERVDILHLHSWLIPLGA